MTVIERRSPPPRGARAHGALAFGLALGLGLALPATTLGAESETLEAKTLDAETPATTVPDLPQLLRDRDVAFPTPNLEPLTRIGLVVAGLGALGWGASAFVRRRRLAGGVELSRIEVLTVKSLGASHRLAIVEVGDRRLLIGMGKDSIASIADLTDAPAFEETLARELPAERKDNGKRLLQSIGRFEGLDV